MSIHRIHVINLPQKPRDHQNAAEQNPAGIGSNISGLHVAQTAGDAANQLPDTVDGAIDHDDVDEFPQELARRLRRSATR